MARAPTTMRSPRHLALPLGLLAACASAPPPALAPDLPAPTPSAPAPVATTTVDPLSAAAPPPEASAAPSAMPLASAVASSPPPVPPVSDALPAFGAGQGVASYYTTDNKGSCSLNPPANRHVLSASRNIYQSIAACGACLEIKGDAGSAIVQVMDLCFSCPEDNLVISKPAFESIVGKQSGKGSVSWKTVACPVEGRVSVRIKESSSRHWTAVQIRDSKLPLRSVEIQRDGESDWVPTTRSADNYWAVAKGAGDAGFKVRITSVTGQQIEETVAKGWKDGKVYPGAHQF